MKKVIYTFLIAAFLIFGLYSEKAISQTDTNNVLLEYCTGTWCGYCPCGHQIIQQAILPTYPNTVVIAYHGTSSDPWYAYSQTMLSAFGFSGYPTGVVGRTSGIISRSAWFSQVSYQATLQPGVKVAMINKTYNAGTRLMTATVNTTAVQNLPAGDYKVLFVITEDNLVYPQNHYASCGYTGYINDYVHKHVVKAVINAPYGEALTSAAWNSGTTITKEFSFTLPSHILYTNATLNAIVYLNAGSLSSGAAIQNAKVSHMADFVITGVTPVNEVMSGYQLSQNYPNPFNPTTNIRFNVPKDGRASLKIYDIKGNEVAVYLDQDIKAGAYNVDFDGSKLTSGVYFYRLTAGTFSETKRMMLIK